MFKPGQKVRRLKHVHLKEDGDFIWDDLEYNKIYVVSKCIKTVDYKSVPFVVTIVGNGIWYHPDGFKLYRRKQIIKLP